MLKLASTMIPIASAGAIVVTTIIPKMTSVMVEWTLMSTEWGSFKFMFLLDLKSSIFSLLVMIITLSIVIYSNYYMSANRLFFIKVVITFMVSMIVLIISPNMISMVLGWEGLGMSSFILIMFYQNKKSMMSAMFTMMMNRIGDATLVMGMVMMMNFSSWTISSTAFIENELIFTLMVISMFTKSAQIPFSSWLTEAMAAPTPVSALVHSSTLVTAGVYLMIRFEPKIKNSKLTLVVLIIAMMTLIMASMNSILESDVKKVIALSTLSQLSIMFVSISMSMFSMAFYHMIMHAMFKALIFLCSSTFISNSNTQNLTKMSSSSSNSMTTTISFNTASMVLCSFPFTASFYSKELILETVMTQNMVVLLKLSFMMSMAATTIYTVKLMILMNSTAMPNCTKMKSESASQQISKIMLVIPAITAGNELNWVVNTNYSVPYMTIQEKLVPLMMLGMVLMTAPLTNCSIISKNSKMKMMVNYMWYMKTMNLQFKKSSMALMLMSLKTVESGVIYQSQNTIMALTAKISKSAFTKTHSGFTTTAMTILMMVAIMVYLSSLKKAQCWSH
uniref:NADH:ubiquinone reductase (H(+)-translocating) n=1 Tax=Singhiella simplex TaxID=1608328 RepID=A0A7G2CXA2_9HEMI|nr:NADH dehydrogenase subunit 5 [Singhiella simplex]